MATDAHVRVGFEVARVGDATDAQQDLADSERERETEEQRERLSH